MKEFLLSLVLAVLIVTSTKALGGDNFLGGVIASILHGFLGNTFIFKKETN